MFLVKTHAWVWGPYLPGAGGDLSESAQSSKGVAAVHAVQRLGAVPQQAEADRALVVGMGMLVAAPRRLLNNPGGRDEAETADGDQSGGQQHPKAAHAAEHAGSVGQKAQIEREPGFFFLLLLPAQHLPPTSASHYPGIRNCSSRESPQNICSGGAGDCQGPDEVGLERAGALRLMGGGRFPRANANAET